MVGTKRKIRLIRPKKKIRQINDWKYCCKLLILRSARVVARDNSQSFGEAQGEFNIRSRPWTLRFQLEPGRCQRVQPAPDETVDRQDDERHQHRRDEKDRIVPFVRRATDHGTQSSR
jgi:hypothetical protein